ncbi:Peptidoglycan/xylan/chitin deacetylase, PgdA/CDA1 family [Fulvimarina manganoxydans]|uniref:Chitooligosaccharide deacetylase n=1 Tax=Fulvimarina manganoxydans TaxID=937218 RepID=A0A1W2DZT2_9HYPH|nr:polysaccharide deacetylase family protein [Fulvimarina manganoxydans]SMD02993.1 Peptidoglycan/xylan/chitin deacetylase, PgdA/CDA1 family [Fulvimarina manganoxydans]
MSLTRLGAALLSLASLSACASNEAGRLALSSPPAQPTALSAPTLAFGAQPVAVDGGFPLYQSFQPARRSALAGRTIAVAQLSDIDLQPGEVVLTFDDGPMPGKTPKILDALEKAGVGATFLMVGQMAKAYPSITREVAAKGHTIGTHTESHKNLRTLGTEAAMAEIRRGEASVAKALAPAGFHPAPFFRFPYLADTQALRGRLAGEGVVTIDVDIDSKDYFRDGPSRVMARTLDAVERKRHGIILFHDIQARTVAMLPDFLAELERRGYKVVDLKPAEPMGPQLLAQR